MVARTTEASTTNSGDIKLPLRVIFIMNNDVKIYMVGQAMNIDIAIPCVSLDSHIYRN
jgi:hypothetical protein